MAEVRSEKLRVADGRVLEIATLQVEIFTRHLVQYVHLPIVADPDDTEYSSIVVEPIPQDRPAAWTIKEYKRLQAARTKIMVYGQLFFDNVHFVRDDPDNEEGLTSQPKRFTVWEVHPVSRIFECVKSDASCDPKTVNQWKEIK